MENTKKTIMLIIAFLCASLDLISQPGNNCAPEPAYKYSLDSNMAQVPWKRVNLNPYNDASNQTLFLKRITHDAFIKKQTRLYELIVNPELLLGAAADNRTGENYFISGGGGNLKYYHGEQFVFKAQVVSFSQNGNKSDSLRTDNNLLQNAFYSESTEHGYKAFDLRINALYKPSRFFGFGLGIDNHFAGDGYHSVILGDDVAPHPYGKISTSFWKIDYTVGYHFLKDIRWPDFSDTYQKYMTTHQLNMKLHPRFHVYAWEAVVWKQEDSIVQRNYDISYLNPVIFFRPVEFQLGSPSPDNILLGLGFRWQPFSWVRIYGQAMFDEFYLKEISARNGWWANKFALQLGINSAFSSGEHYFQMRGEFNMARPFTYTHIGSMQNYGSRFTPLAHPLGANFGEALSTIRWQWKRLGALARIAFARIGHDGDVNFGQNIYRSYTDREEEYGHTWLQGNVENIVSADLRLMYTINPAMNLSLSLGVRKLPNYISHKDDLEEVYLRLSTFLAPQMKQLYQ